MTTMQYSRFDMLHDPRPTDKSLPAFMVSTSRGFLPRDDPVVKLPVEFNCLECLLERMPTSQADHSPGLLARGKLGNAVIQELPDLTDSVDKYSHDLPLMNALYRDYFFLASAYLLEPCHLRFLQGEAYGLGRDRLPSCIARPIARAASIIGFKPFMEYAGSYALYNYKKANPDLGLEYSNLRLIRAFENGLDPASSEAGFVLVHVDMAKHSGLLVAGAAEVLDAVGSGRRESFNAGMQSVVNAMTKVNIVMDKMWDKSRPNDYTSFRTFIFGITNQSMFPNGVVYEGVSEEPLYFRGESGANDSMDFRSYRPGNHREYLEFVKEEAEALGVFSFALKDESSIALYVQALNQVRDFRWRHWCFTREYILKRTTHPTATGGSPIITWLPNQLQAVLELILSIGAQYANGLKSCEDVFSIASRQRDTLNKEVKKYCEARTLHTS